MVRRYNKDAFTSRNSASKYMKQKKKKELKKEVDNSGTIIEILISITELDRKLTRL